MKVDYIDTALDQLERSESEHSEHLNNLEESAITWQFSSYQVFSTVYPSEI